MPGCGCACVCVCVRVGTVEYQQLIDDIVRDGRLYSSHQHRQVLKVRSPPCFADHDTYITNGFHESGMKLAGSEAEVDNIGDCANKYG